MPGEESKGGEKENPERPEGIGHGLAFADRFRKWTKLRNRPCLGEIALAGVGEVGGGVEEADRSLFDAEESRLGGCAKLPGSFQRKGERAIFTKKLQGCGLGSGEVGNGERLAQFHVPAFLHDLSAPEIRGETVDEDDESGEPGSIRGDDIEVEDELLHPRALPENHK